MVSLLSLICIHLYNLYTPVYTCAVFLPGVQRTCRRCTSCQPSCTKCCWAQRQAGAKSHCPKTIQGNLLQRKTLAISYGFHTEVLFKMRCHQTLQGSAKSTCLVSKQLLHHLASAVTFTHPGSTLSKQSFLIICFTYIKLFLTVVTGAEQGSKSAFPEMLPSAWTLSFLYSSCSLPVGNFCTTSEFHWRSSLSSSQLAFRFCSVFKRTSHAAQLLWYRALFV